MFLIRKYGVRFLILSLSLTSFFVAKAFYVPTGRDTLLPPDSVTYDIAEPTEMELLFETENFKYYYRESRDTFAIYDVRNNYTWKTGLDLEYAKDIDDDCDDMMDRFDANDPLDVVTDEMLLGACRDKEVKLNTTYTGFANSLITIEYFDQAKNIKRISSASYEDVTSKLMTVNGDESHRRLDVDFRSLDIEISVHIYFDNDGLRYEIRDEEITGDGISALAAIIVSPFIGASGGAYETFSLEEMDYLDDEVMKYAIPGYSFVPDGSGTLIRYNNNSVKLSSFEGTIYGTNPAQDIYYGNVSTSYVPFKTASMPVFGMAHGNLQAAFVAFATSGDEYMQIVSMPEENLTYYNFTYPRFEYNKQYFQVYNKNGDGYFTNYEDRNHFDVDMRYNFLAGDGTDGYSADYVGMALSYRDYLLENGILHELTTSHNEIPIRLDFFMSDSEKGIAGYINQVTTSYSGVQSVLDDIVKTGITNINSGLLGWNDGGVTLGDPSDTDFTRDIGSKSQFESLLQEFKNQGIDISFSQNYYVINEEMMTLRTNAAKHTSTWYTRTDIFDIPISMLYYARPVRSAEWLKDQTNTFANMGVESFTVTGITNNLTSDYTTDLSREEAKAVIRDAFASLDESKLINAYQPNMYLWEYVDRYLNTPVYGTQYLVETDTVPFLQLVLYNTMELYAPYSNFSFYTDSDILRMIDYNIYPSFVLTYEPAYLLSDT
ncbi:MAG: hypothetical protein KJ847_06610, partial [Firmicutes bacterium]|nr:hypothetical protein [Bacillota bacterium]